MPTELSCRYQSVPVKPSGPVCESCSNILANAKDNQLKQHYRGCANCLTYDPVDGKCRIKPPFPEVKPTDWCREWQSALIPKWTWSKPLAPPEAHYPDRYNKEAHRERQSEMPV